ncbi:hypothetical protein LSH36_1051g00013 [Paralvinella palmiformis]|uniref:Uncharacterized protein n=1 Tax=Paralvinella palmiformis TaxID=53620 RepID=A0AAD9IWQ0_9ANNE|nr:hypothetical protein LSH36_1051g00013 [Paralvinella palmiformis]
MLKLFGFKHKSSKTSQQSLVPSLDGNQPYNPYTQITVYSHHTNIIRHLLLVDKTRLASASDDTQIVIWDLQTSQQIHVLDAHSRPITCLLVLQSAYTSGDDCNQGAEDSDGLLLISAASDKLICCFLHLPDFGCFCSGGEKLCLWTPEGEMMVVVDRQNEEGCGSLDGTIILWSSQALAPSRYFNSITDYLGDNRILPYSIQAMICLDECYLICAIGTGFCIYDIVHGCSVTQKKHAHYSKILSLALVHNGTLLATVSEDGSLRLWGFRKTFTEPSPIKKDSPAFERLFGYVCLNAGWNGLLTCGADGLIINWKDGTYESMKLNTLLQDIYSSLE